MAKVFVQDIAPYRRKEVSAPWAGKPTIITSFSNPKQDTGLQTSSKEGVFEGSYLGGKLYVNAEEGAVVSWGQTAFVRYNRGWTKYGIVQGDKVLPLTREEACAKLVARLNGAPIPEQAKQEEETKAAIEPPADVKVPAQDQENQGKEVVEDKPADTQTIEDQQVVKTEDVAEVPPAVTAPVDPEPLPEPTQEPTAPEPAANPAEGEELGNPAENSVEEGVETPTEQNTEGNEEKSSGIPSLD